MHDRVPMITAWAPELAALSSDGIHELWLRPHGAPAGYPEPVVDHGVERAEALARYHLVRSGREFDE